jgi:hypothetical protein
MKESFLIARDPRGNQDGSVRNGSFRRTQPPGHTFLTRYGAPRFKCSGILAWEAENVLMGAASKLQTIPIARKLAR